MAIKKEKYKKKAFESTGESWDTSANIYMSMLMSEAWNQLTKGQQILYVYCKAQYYAEKRKPVPEYYTHAAKTQSELFTFNKSKWHHLYKLYTPNGQFYKDINKLIELGFIERVQSGKTTRTKNIYKYSSKWRYYKAKKEAK